MAGISGVHRRRLLGIFIAASALSMAFGGGTFLLGLRRHRAHQRLLGDQVQDLLYASRLQVLIERKSSAARRYLLTLEADDRGEFEQARSAAQAALSGIERRLTTPAGASLLRQIELGNAGYDASVEAALDEPEARRAYLFRTDPDFRDARRRLFEPVRLLVALKRADLEAALSDTTVYAQASLLLSGLLGPALLLSLLFLWRSFRGTLGSLDAAERALTEAKADLEATVERRTRRLTTALEQHEAFAYSVAHDLRAPARAAASYAELVLRRGAGLDEQSRRHLERAAEAGRRLREMLDALLELALLAGRRPARQPLDLGAEARALAETLPRPGPELEVASPLPALADRELARVVLRALLDNAWRFARSRVRVGSREGAFFVEDDGAGFDPAFADRLFKPFHRLSNAVDSPGLGVGLARAARAVEAHGGRIRAESRPGAGTTILFTFEP